MQKKSNDRKELQSNTERKSKIAPVIRAVFYSLIFFVPLIMYSGTSELFEFNKMLFIYLISAIAGFLFITDIILYKRKAQFPDILTYTSLLFLISQTLSTFFSIDFHTSLFGYYGRFNGGLFSIIAYMILLYTFIQYFNAQTLQKFLKISLVSSTLVILWGLPGKFGYDLSCLLFTGHFNNTCWTDQFRPSERMFSTLGQPNWLGAYLAIHFFIGIYFFICAYNQKSYFNKILLFAYTFLNFSAILFTRSRSTLGAVLISLALLPLCLLAINFRKQKILETLKSYIYIIIMIVLTIAIFRTGVAKIDTVIEYIPSKILAKKTAESAKPVYTSPVVSQTQMLSSGVTDSFDIRKIVWKGATDLGNKYPFFGTGVETFAYSYYFIRPVEHNLTSEWDFLYNKAHNEFLNYFATTGYTGIITYSILIVAVFYLGISEIIKIRKSESKNKDSDQFLIICLLLSYLTISITNFFGFSTTTVNVFFYLTPGFIYALHITEPLPDAVTGKIAKLRRASMFVPLTVLLYVLLFLIQYFNADLQYNIAEGHSRSGDYQKAAVVYNDLMKTHYEHVYEDKLSYVLANLAYVASYQKEKETADNLLKLARFYNQKSLNASPANINYWKTAVKNDYLFYQTELNPEYISDGLEKLNSARTISPTDPKLPYSQALFYSVLEDEEKDVEKKQDLQQKSIGAINTAIKLKSDYRDSYFLKGQLLKKYGKKDEAKKTFQFILDYVNGLDEEVKQEMQDL